MRFPIIVSVFCILLCACQGNAPKETKAAAPPDSTATSKADSIATAEIDKKGLLSELKKYETEPQRFSLKASGAGKIKGREGTIIMVEPTDLVCEDGSAIGGTIEVELKELENVSQLMQDNAATISDGVMLASGGAYYIGMSSGGKKLKVREGRTLRVQFPKKSNAPMSLFYGQRDSTGQMNWEPAKEKFVAAIKPDIGKSGDEEDNSDDFFGRKDKGSTTFIGSQHDSGKITDITTAGGFKNMDMNNLTMGSYHERKAGKTNTDTKKAAETRAVAENISRKIYDEVGLQRLGWINCDRYVSGADLNSLAFQFNATEPVKFARVYLVYKGINSLASVDYREASHNNEFRNVPAGSQVRVIAFTYKKGKLYSGFTDDVSSADKNKFIGLSMKESTDDEIRNLFKLK